LDALKWWWLGVFIAPTTKPTVGVGLLSMGAPDSPVRQPPHLTVRVWPLELWQTGPPDSPVPHRTGTVYCPVCLLAPTLTLRELSTHCSAFQVSVGVDRCAVAVAPLAHRTVRWIIAEWHFQKPEGEELELIHPGAPDTVRWCTGQSGAPDQGILRFLLLLSFWTLTCTFLLVCVEPFAPVELII
jgi:hypothetical protein